MSGMYFFIFASCEPLSLDLDFGTWTSVFLSYINDSSAIITDWKLYDIFFSRMGYFALLFVGGILMIASSVGRVFYISISIS